LSVDVELTASVTGPAGSPDNADASRIALYRVLGTVVGANDPIEVPIVGRVAQVNVVSVHVLGANDTRCESTEPAKVSVVVFTEKVAPTRVVPVGAVGSANFR
jgi:hypothetical protein